MAFARAHAVELHHPLRASTAFRSIGSNKENFFSIISIVIEILYYSREEGRAAIEALELEACTVLEIQKQ
jgi:hypothetical protein